MAIAIVSCQKTDDDMSFSKPGKKSSTHIAFWNGYNFFSAYNPHHNSIFTKYPNPAAWEQSLNELEYYTAFGMSEMVANHSSGSIMIDDMLKELNLNNGIIFAESFFNKYPAYLTLMDSYISVAYGVQYSNLLTTVVGNGLPYGVTIQLPPFINSSTPTTIAPAIAIAAELPQPDSTTIVRVDENNVNDYYDDDDFIPCFYPNSSEELVEYSEALVGFDDYYNSSTLGEIDESKLLLVVSSEEKANAGDNWLYHVTITEVTLGDDSGNNLPNTGQGCEKASSLSLENLTVYNRYQRYGKSRIRLSHNVQHYLDTKTRFYDGDSRFHIANLKKNEFPTGNFINTLLFFKGYDYTNTSVNELTNPSFNISPQDYSYYPMVFEYDWYAHPKGQSGYNSTLGEDMTTQDRMKKKDEHYKYYYVEIFNWCYPSLVNHDLAGKSESDLVGGNQ